MLKSPLAYLNLSGERLPRPNVTAGATANTCGKPRSTCGIRSSPPLQSLVMWLKAHIDTPNKARPNIINQRVSNLRARRMYAGTPASDAAPLEKIATPVCHAL